MMQFAIPVSLMLDVTSRKNLDTVNLNQAVHLEDNEEFADRILSPA